MTTEILGNTYYAAFGHFIHQFARAESYTVLYMSLMAGVDNKTAKSIFSGTRLETAVSYVRRMYEARGWQLESELEACLSHLVAINGLRNDLVHYGPSPGDDGIVVTTSKWAHVPEKARTRGVSTQTLVDLTNDIADVLTTMAIVLNNRFRDPDPGIAELTKGHQTPIAWRYKPPAQVSNRHKTSDTPPKPKRPPKPSPA